MNVFFVARWHIQDAPRTCTWLEGEDWPCRENEWKWARWAKTGYKGRNIKSMCAIICSHTNTKCSRHSGYCLKKWGGHRTVAYSSDNNGKRHWIWEFGNKFIQFGGI